MRAESKAWAAATVKRRLREVERSLEALSFDLRHLEGRLHLPSPEELRRIESGEAPFTAAVVLAGLLRSVRPLVERVSFLIHETTSYTPEQLRRLPRRRLLDAFREDVLPGLRLLIEEVELEAAEVRANPEPAGRLQADFRAGNSEPHRTGDQTGRSGKVERS
jgi:hypothetical protein